MCGLWIVSKPPSSQPPIRLICRHLLLAKAFISKLNTDGAAGLVDERTQSPAAVCGRLQTPGEVFISSRRGCRDCLVSASLMQRASRLLNHSPGHRFHSSAVLWLIRRKILTQYLSKELGLKMWQFVHDLNLSPALTFFPYE